MKHPRFITRRRFLQASSFAAAATALPASLSRAAFAETAHDAPLEQFSYDSVKLADGLALRQRDETHAVLMSLSIDDLLRPFRLRETLPAPGSDLGGWYDTESFAPCHSFGQWLSALSRYYAATGDDATYAKLDGMLRGYAATIEPAGRFFEHNRFPAYTYDKLVCGLIDAHEFAHYPAAIEVLARTTDAASAHLPGKAMPHWETPATLEDQYDRHSWDESYTISENLFIAAQRTGDPRYLALAKQYLYRADFYDPLARGENVLPGKHAYSHVNSLGSAAMGYLALNDPSLLQAAINGHRFVREQSYATGGWGPDEHFITPGSGKLGAGLADEHHSFETPCGAYAHFKLSRYLLRITRDPIYGDSMEQVLYNTVLGAKPLQSDGSAFYYADYTPHTNKGYFRDPWPCCSGTLPQISADYGISTYLHDANSIYVNLYLPSTLHWKSGRSAVEIQQSGNYPLDGDIHFTVTTSRPVNFALRLRIPAWASDGTAILVNGKPASITANSGTFATLQRKWKSGDHVELHLPLPMRLTPVDAEHPNLVALSRGPLVLFAIDNESTPSLTSSQLLAARRIDTTSDIWEVQSTGGPIQFKPFTAIDDESYTTYLKLSPESAV